MARNDAGQKDRDKMEWFPTINYAKSDALPASRNAKGVFIQ
jgi:hypothetical protein